MMGGEDVRNMIVCDCEMMGLVGDGMIVIVMVVWSCVLVAASVREGFVRGFRRAAIVSRAC